MIKIIQKQNEGKKVSLLVFEDEILLCEFSGAMAMAAAGAFIKSLTEKANHIDIAILYIFKDSN